MQYNLFAGTVLGLGGEEQLAALDDMQAAGALGCFALTEKLAGVNSGLVVNTTAEWDDAKKVFVLNTPDTGSEKNWISQGFTADKAVVLADLTVGGVSHGPHAFVTDLRDAPGGALVPGVAITDMGRKTVGNDLDNAAIQYDNAEFPRDALLNRFAQIDDDGNYVKADDAAPHPFTMIGQRLFSGRVAVAQAALAFRRELFARTQAYSDAKKTCAPDGTEGPPLSALPQLTHLYAEAEATGAELEAFTRACEARLSECLRAHALPPPELQAAIACAKVRAVEESIALCHRLKQEVGSYALMHGTGFEQLDFLQCTKFAEGDSRILMQKMARDRMRAYAKQTAGAEAGGAEETQRCAALAEAVARDAKASGLGDARAAQQAGWDANWVDVYGLAEATMDRVMGDFMAGEEQA